MGAAVEHAHGAPMRASLATDLIELTTVGVDVGSATCHFIVSRVRVERVGGRYAAVSSDTVHISPVFFTPYLGDGRIDGRAIEGLFSRELTAAGIGPASIDSGVVILTGTALARENARAVGDVLAASVGDFVSVAAGDVLEGILAAHGSGAVERSRHSGPVVNVDIGGGTTKLTWCENGRAGPVAAIDIGSRLVAWDADFRVSRAEATAQNLARATGIDLDLGRRLDPIEIGTLAAFCARMIAAAAGIGPQDALTTSLHRTDPIPFVGRAESLLFSGGVSELLDVGTGSGIFDLGPGIAEGLRTYISAAGKPAEPARQGIRATVIGASRYSVQVSGPTCRVEESVLPMRNLAVVSVDPRLLAGDIDPDAVAESLETGAKWVDPESYSRVGVFVGWQGSATFHRLRRLALGLAGGLRQRFERGEPLVVVCDGDVGAVLGRHLAEVLPPDCQIMVLDGIELRDLQYVDIARSEGGGITVTIKSLLFPAG